MMSLTLKVAIFLMVTMVRLIITMTRVMLVNDDDEDGLADDNSDDADVVHNGQ